MEFRHLDVSDSGVATAIFDVTTALACGDGTLRPVLGVGELALLLCFCFALAIESRGNVVQTLDIGAVLRASASSPWGRGAAVTVLSWKEHLLRQERAHPSDGDRPAAQ